MFPLGTVTQRQTENNMGVSGWVPAQEKWKPTPTRTLVHDSGVH